MSFFICIYSGQSAGNYQDGSSGWISGPTVFKRGRGGKEYRTKAEFPGIFGLGRWSQIATSLGEREREKDREGGEEQAGSLRYSRLEACATKMRYEDCGTKTKKGDPTGRPYRELAG